MASSITGKAYWDSTIKICEAAISMLSPFENQDYYLADAAVESLQQLIRHGRTLDNLKKYKQHHVVQQQQKKSRWANRQTPAPSNQWIVKNESEVEISLRNNRTPIIAKAITTEEQLRAIVQVIQNKKCFSIDCEFLALKNSQPRLKVLQIAVSKTVGFAILVDRFDDIGIIRDVLGEVLEDESILRIGWAVRADAQSIEQTIPGIKLGRILDLQTLVYQDAVETMKLGNAMTKYASDWEGFEEFTYAKDMGNSFSFTDGDCIWLQDPLPCHGLVYAVFDVVSLFALHEKLNHIEVKENTYWPTNVVSKLSGKALQKWYQNRCYVPESRPTISDEDVIGLDEDRFSLSPFTNTTNSNSGGGVSDLSSNKLKQKAKETNYSSIPTTNSAIGMESDEDPNYIADLEKAKWMSLQDQILHSDQYPAGTSASTSGNSSNTNTSHGSPETTRKVSTWDQGQGRKMVMEEEYTFDDMDNISVDSANINSDNEDIKFATEIYEPSRKLAFEQLPQDTWGEVDTARLPENSWQTATIESPAPVQAPLLNNHNISNNVNTNDNATMNTTKTTTATTTTMSSSSSSSSSPAAAAAASKWNNTWAVPYSDRTTGAFVNAPPTHDHAGWQQFAQKSQTDWKKGNDSSISDYDKSAKHFTKNPDHTTQYNKPSPLSNQPLKFNTIVAPTVSNQWSGGDGWEVKDNKPDMMTMPLPGFKARKTFGPKMVNMYDSDDISDDDDEDYNTDDDTNDDDDNNDNDTDNNNEGNGSNKNMTTTRTKPIMDTFRDVYNMDDGRVISLHAIYRPEQIDTPVEMPKDGRPLTVSISVHFHMSPSWNSQFLPKGLTIYTNAGDAYSIALDRICAFTDPDTLEHSTIGYFLTSPDVRRISWRHGFFRNAVNEKLGFKVGHVDEISDRLRPDEQRLKMKDVLNKYIGHWKGMEQYEQAKNDVTLMEQAALRKFSGSTWDKEKLTDATLIFSAAQGAMLHELDNALE